jgi:hypothetical protein
MFQVWTTSPCRSMRYTFLFCTKCGANSVNPGKVRSGSHARNPTPRRLRVFCSIAAMGGLLSNDGTRSERGKAGEQHASLQERRVMVDHRAACDGDNGSCPVRLVSNRAAAAWTTRSRFEDLDMLQSLAWAQRINFRASPKNSHCSARDS